MNDAKNSELIVELETASSDAFADPTHADLFSLRMKYASTPLYEPYLPARLNEKFAIQKLRPKEMDESTRIRIEAYLKNTPVDIQIHLCAAAMREQFGDSDLARSHVGFAEGLLHSILNSGDGRQRETAFVVISVDEEYDCLQAFALTLVKQAAYDDQNGKHYDCLEVMDPTTGDRADMWFGTDIPREWIKRRLRAHLPLTEPVSQTKKRRWWRFGGGLTVSSIAGWRVIFTVAPILIAFMCAFLTGIMFGYLPARKAAQLDPYVNRANEPDASTETKPFTPSISRLYFWV